MSAVSDPASSAIKEFLLRIRELGPADASSLFERSFPPGNELRDEALRFWQRAEQQREAALQPEPVWNEREELKTAGYELQRKLGSGGGGSVYVAIQQHPCRTVAVKFLATKLGREAAIRMQREIELTCRIQHPDLVEVYVAGETSRGRPYFVMEYVDGLDIFAQSQRQGWHLEKRLQLIARVSEAVGTLHRRGVIHQDLKPANILVTEQAHPKIIDFGIARSVYADWQDEKVARLYSEPPRTEDYAPPEQRSFVPLETSVDSFALGRVLLKLLTGELSESDKPVAPSRSAISLDPRILGFANDAALRKRYRGDLDAIVLKATAPEPGNRYREAGALAEDLHRFLSKRPVSAVPNTPAHEVRLFVRRYPSWVALSAFFILMLLLTTGYAWRETLRANEARRVAEEALWKERSAKEAVLAAKGDIEKAVKSYEGTVNLLTEHVVESSKRLRKRQSELAVVEVDQWISLWDFARSRQAPETVEMSMLMRALRRIEDAKIEHPRKLELAKRAEYLKPRVGENWRSGDGLPNIAAWNSTMTLEMALLQIDAAGSITEPSILDREVQTAILGRREDLQSWRTLRETACGTSPQHILLRKQVRSLLKVCQ